MREEVETLDDNEVFEDALAGRLMFGATVADIVACINLKFASCDDEGKQEVLTEVLNEIKLILMSIGSLMAV